ncbi:MAG: UMP kinase [Candidatus Micrarchaeota archaeon]
MPTIVVSLGGSLLFDKEGRFNLKDAKKLAGMLVSVHSRGIRLIVITGGGRRAREYANAARRKHGTEFDADREAIRATRENARAIIGLMGSAAYGRVLEKFDDADNAFKRNKIAVGAGLLEGLTTDAVSVLFAEKARAAAVVNLGDTDGIYSSDPKKHKNAKRFTKMTHRELVDLAIKSDSRLAGTHFVFDLVAAKLAARSGMELRFVDGRDLGESEMAILGKKFSGTVVKSK